MGVTAAWPNTTLHIFLFFFLLRNPTAVGPPRRMINQFAADEEFIVLFKIGFRFSSAARGRCV